MKAQAGRTTAQLAFEPAHPLLRYLHGSEGRRVGAKRCSPVQDLFWELLEGMAGR